MIKHSRERFNSVNHWNGYTAERLHVIAKSIERMNTCYILYIIANITERIRVIS